MEWILIGIMIIVGVVLKLMNKNNQINWIINQLQIKKENKK